MYLNWETTVPHVFFEWWTADTEFSFLVSNVLIFLICFAFEGLVNFRSRYDAYLNDSAVFPLDTKSKRTFTLEQNLIRSGLFALSNTLSLTIMMFFMLFNGYICISCVAGAFAGHLFFAIYFPEDEISKRPRSCCD